MGEDWLMNLPTNAGKALRVHGFRGSQIGDSVAALSLLAWARQQWPDCYTMWQVARKHAHAIPLFYNHDLIDQLSVSDCNEGYGPRDAKLASTAHARFPLMPEHPEPWLAWPNVRTFYEETFVMGGLPAEAYRSMAPDVRRPKLTRWFEVDRKPRTIGYWPCAAYGQVQTLTIDGKRVVRSRNASRQWANHLVQRLKSEGYTVIQYGHPNDYADCGGALEAHGDARACGFMDQIISSLSCDLVIGTDSGAGIALGAYGCNQISLLTNHFPGHTVNLTAFQPDNPNNVSLVGEGSADNISIDTVVETIRQIQS